MLLQTSISASFEPGTGKIKLKTQTGEWTDIPLGPGVEKAITEVVMSAFAAFDDQKKKAVDAQAKSPSKSPIKRLPPQPPVIPMSGDGTRAGYIRRLAHAICIGNSITACTATEEERAEALAMLSR